MALVPTIVLGPVAGPLIDRLSRRWILVLSDASIAFFTLILAALFWLDAVELWHVYAILFLRSLGDAFQLPTMRATTSMMVPDDQLTRVTGLNQTLDGIIQIVAPPVGALLLSLLSTQGVLAIDTVTALLAIDTVTALLAIVPLLFVPVPQPEPSQPKKAGASMWSDMKAGVGFVWGWKGLLLMILTTSTWRLLAFPAFRSGPPLVSEYFGAGALELGWMHSAMGIGIVVGGFILGAWGGFHRRMYTNILGVVGIGTAFLWVSLSPPSLFPLALAGMAVLGFSMPICTGPTRAIYQSVVPPDMQGRFFTMQGSLSAAMTPLGLALGGVSATAWDVRLLWIIGGVSSFLIAAIRFVTPAIRYLEDEPGHAAPDA